MAKAGETTWDAPGLRRRLLGWYEVNRRDLPWRRSRDPYAIWVSEIMLQQTRVAVVVERYLAFMAKFPSLAALAAAEEQEVLALWSGLGYYRRARMLLRAAQHVVAHCGGIMPATAEHLLDLPGIGGYTAAAIASIAHGEPVAVVDGNVERVLCRLAGWDAGQGKGGADVRRNIEGLAAELVDPRQPGDFNQAMMELGATVCVPRNPQCLVCPWVETCRTRGEHKPAPRAPTVTRTAAYALAVRTIGEGLEVLLVQRPAALTVMPGLWELPALRDAEIAPEKVRMTVRHAIMQVNYVVRICAVTDDEVTAWSKTDSEKRWVPVGRTDAMALTGLARKVLRRAELLPDPAASNDSRKTSPDACVTVER
jgi:A/G-specific adenine glycosylase